MFNVRRSFVLATMLTTMAGCSFEAGGEESLDGTRPSEEAVGVQGQALATSYPLAYQQGGMECLYDRPADTTGFLGWQGATTQIFGIPYQYNAFYLPNVARGVRHCMATLYWTDFKIPETGGYRLDGTSAPIRIRGTTKVSGSGWAWSSDDARATVYLNVVAHLNNGSQILFDRRLIAKDATRSEVRTKSFSADIPLPQDLTFQAKAGQSLSFYVQLDLDTWTSSEGSAEIGVKTFGIPTLDPNRLMFVYP